MPNNQSDHCLNHTETIDSENSYFHSTTITHIILQVYIDLRLQSHTNEHIDCLIRGSPIHSPWNCSRYSQTITFTKSYISILRSLLSKIMALICGLSQPSLLAFFWSYIPLLFRSWLLLSYHSPFHISETMVFPYHTKWK